MHTDCTNQLTHIDLIKPGTLLSKAKIHLLSARNVEVFELKCRTSVFLDRSFGPENSSKSASWPIQSSGLSAGGSNATSRKPHFLTSLCTVAVAYRWLPLLVLWEETVTIKCHSKCHQWLLRWFCERIHTSDLGNNLFAPFWVKAFDGQVLEHQQGFFLTKPQIQRKHSPAGFMVIGQKWVSWGVLRRRHAFFFPPLGWH